MTSSFFPAIGFIAPSDVRPACSGHLWWVPRVPPGVPVPSHPPAHTGSWGPATAGGAGHLPVASVHPVFWTLAASACSGWHCPDTLTRDGNGCSDGDTSANSPRGQHHLHGCHGEFCLAAPLGPCPSPPPPFPLKAPELFGAVRLVRAASEHPPAWGRCSSRCGCFAVCVAPLGGGGVRAEAPGVAGRAPCSCPGFLGSALQESAVLRPQQRCLNK